MSKAMHRAARRAAVAAAAILFISTAFPSCRMPDGEAAAHAKKGASASKAAGSGVKSFDDGRLKLKWKLEGDKLKVRIASSYEGYMAFGINTKPSMTGADLVIAVLGDGGKVRVEDHFCKAGKVHKPDKAFGGSSRILRRSVKRWEAWTAVDIVLDALSDDPNDVPVEKGKRYYFLVAASEKSSLEAEHSFHGRFRVSF